jgi:hypothetical protein
MYFLRKFISNVDKFEILEKKKQNVPEGVNNKKERWVEQSVQNLI